MSALVVIAIVFIVVAAALVIIGAIRRREVNNNLGTLSRESKNADVGRRKAETAGAAAPGLQGREIERAAVIDRVGGAIEPVGATAPAEWVAPDPETYDVTRRQFLNRSIVGLMGLSITAFAAASFVGFLWPIGGGGFGGLIRIGKINDILSEIDANQGFLYKPEGRMWVTRYPASALPKAREVYAGQASLPGMEAGIVALYQKCPHLGCRVPDCKTSQWFECPCHGSQYNQVGEKKGGPAPRGMDRFPVAVAPDGSVTVDTAGSKIIQGPPIGTNTTGQEAEGPNCVGSSEGHS